MPLSGLWNSFRKSVRGSGRCAPCHHHQIDLEIWAFMILSYLAKCTIQIESQKGEADKTCNVAEYYLKMSRNMRRLSFVLVVAGFAFPHLLPHAGRFGVVLLGTGICVGLKIVAARYEDKTDGMLGLPH